MFHHWRDPIHESPPHLNTGCFTYTSNANAQLIICVSLLMSPCTKYILQWYLSFHDPSITVKCLSLAFNKHNVRMEFILSVIVMVLHLSLQALTIVLVQEILYTPTPFLPLPASLRCHRRSCHAGQPWQVSRGAWRHRRAPSRSWRWS